MRVRGSLFGLLLAVSGCATIFKGRTDHITVVTDPPGAQVVVNGETKGLSPVTFAVPSNQGLDIKVTKEGYKSGEVSNLPSERSGYELWDVLGGFFPLVIDRTDGAVMGHETTLTVVHLDPQ